MDTFLRAICLCLALEGLLFAIAPNLTRQAMEEICAKSSQDLRKLGCLALGVSTLLAWLLQ